MGVLSLPHHTGGQVGGVEIKVCENNNSTKGDVGF